MLVEQRLYTLHVGKAPEYLRIYENEGLAVHTRHLGRQLGFFTAESGTLHQILYFWAFENFEDRGRRRAQLVADPAWSAFIAKTQQFVMNMESKLWTPTAFSAIR